MQHLGNGVKGEGKEIKGKDHMKACKFTWNSLGAVRCVAMSEEKRLSTICRQLNSKLLLHNILKYLYATLKYCVVSNCYCTVETEFKIGIITLFFYN